MRRLKILGMQLNSAFQMIKGLKEKVDGGLSSSSAATGPVAPPVSKFPPPDFGGVESFNFGEFEDTFEFEA